MFANVCSSKNGLIRESFEIDIQGLSKYQSGSFGISCVAVLAHSILKSWYKLPATGSLSLINGERHCWETWGNVLCWPLRKQRHQHCPTTSRSSPLKIARRRSILAGLRVLKAPAVTRQASSSGWLLSTAKTVVYLHQLVEHRKELQQPLKPSFLMSKTICLGT